MSSLGHLTLWGWKARHQCWDRENRLRHGQESCSDRENRSFHGQESCCRRPSQGTHQRHSYTWGYVIAEKYLSWEIFSNIVCDFLLSSDICEWMCFDRIVIICSYFGSAKPKENVFFVFPPQGWVWRRCQESRVGEERKLFTQPFHARPRVSLLKLSL